MSLCQHHVLRNATNWPREVLPRPNLRWRAVSLPAIGSSLKWPKCLTSPCIAIKQKNKKNNNNNFISISFYDFSLKWQVASGKAERNEESIGEQCGVSKKGTTLCVCVCTVWMVVVVIFDLVFFFFFFFLCVDCHDAISEVGWVQRAARCGAERCRAATSHLMFWFPTVSFKCFFFFFFFSSPHFEEEEEEGFLFLEEEEEESGFTFFFFFFLFCTPF